MNKNWTHTVHRNPANDQGGYADSGQRSSSAQSQEFLSRRDQILSGQTPEPSPLARKQPTAGGASVFRMIRRHQTRALEQRKEPRFKSAEDAARLKINGQETDTVDLSNSGLKIEGDMGIGIGQPVTVHFDGIEAIDGRVVWTKGRMTGLSLPADALKLQVN